MTLRRSGGHICSTRSEDAANRGSLYGWRSHGGSGGGLIFVAVVIGALSAFRGNWLLVVGISFVVLGQTIALRSGRTETNCRERALCPSLLEAQNDQGQDLRGPERWR